MPALFKQKILEVCSRLYLLPWPAGAGRAGGGAGHDAGTAAAAAAV